MSSKLTCEYLLVVVKCKYDHCENRFLLHGNVCFKPKDNYVERVGSLVNIVFR